MSETDRPLTDAISAREPISGEWNDYLAWAEEFQSLCKRLEPALAKANADKAALIEALEAFLVAARMPTTTSRQACDQNIAMYNAVNLARAALSQVQA